MKRIYVCIVISIVMITFSVISEFYVTRKIRQTAELLVQASESRRAGENSAAKGQADSAWEIWRSLSSKSEYLFVDLTIDTEVTVSLSRVIMLAKTDDNERFTEECTATVLLLEHFLSDNRNGDDNR